MVDNRMVDNRDALYENLVTNLSQVVHGINNPLAVVSGHAQLLVELAESKGLDSEVVGYLQNIEEASQRLASELDRLRDVRGEIRPRNVSGDGM
ncbi:MAG: histidine kinase dimerization/phospho-acceptor domain-containing protein [Bacteroidota bacterium]